MIDSTEPAMDSGRRRFLGNAGLPIAATALLPALLGLPSSAETHKGTAENEVGVLSAETLTALRTLAVPTGFRLAAVAGHHRAGDGGGGLFFWDAAFVPDTAAGVSDDGGTYLLPNNPTGHAADQAGRWRRVFDGAINPRWFGALGDDSGRTPQEDGLEISDAPWNRWPHWLTRSQSNNPSYFGFSISSTTPPFSGTDSWDWIGLQLALFSVGERPGEVSVGSGVYQLTKPLFYCGGMRATLTGTGMYQTRLTKKPGCFDNSTVLYLYRTGGVPTVIRGLCFSGPAGGGTKNFTLIMQNNTNGVHLESCWLTACQTGVRYVNNSGDSFVSGCTAEYCETVLHIDLDTAHYPSINDRGSEVTVADCNFWQSASPPTTVASESRAAACTVREAALSVSGTLLLTP